MSEMSESLGQRLKAERERKGLSVQKAADELHLEAWVVDALESGGYGAIGPTVYAKGHLKRYAALLGVPPAEVIEAYESQSPAPAATPQAKAVTMHMRTSAPAGSELSWTSIAGSAVAALALAGLLWWKPWHPRVAAPAASVARPKAVGAALPERPGDSLGPAVSNAGKAPAAVVEEVGSSVAAPESNIAAKPAPGSVAGSGIVGAAGAHGAANGIGASVAVVRMPVAAVRSATEPVAGVGRARLRLSFTSDSWVDVRDAAGLRVYAGNGRANSVKTIAGAAPLRVFLKSASGVQLEINNHAVAIGRQFVAGDVARFEAGADGVLRRDPHDAASRTSRPRG